MTSTDYKPYDFALKRSAQDWFYDCVIGPDNEGHNVQGDSTTFSIKVPKTINNHKSTKSIW